MMNAPAKKQPKDVNSVTQTRFIMIAVRLAPACVLLGWAVGGLPGLLFALSGSIVAAFAVALLSGRLGDGSVNVLYGMSRVDRTFRDRFIGTLNQTRFHKMSKRHDLALECVDEVLAADPDFPEALFVKAQILWEGYQDAAATERLTGFAFPFRSLRGIDAHQPDFYFNVISDIYFKSSAVSGKSIVIFWMDGLYREYMTVPEAVAFDVVKRIKSMANLDTGDRELTKVEHIIFKNHDVPEIKISVTTYPIDGLWEDVVLGFQNS